MNRWRTVISALALSGLLLAVLPSLAAARSAYVTGEDPATDGQAAFKVDLAAGSVAPAISFGGEGTPSDVAIAPDGTRAYVLDFGFSGDEVTPIAVSTNSPETPIPLGGFVGARSIAIAPDGATAYVTAGEDVYKLDLTKGEVVDTISLPGAIFTTGIAITPDGTRAYVAGEEGGEGLVFPIDLLTDVPGTPIPAGESAGGIAITPNGAQAYVTDRVEGTVHRIGLAAGAVDATIPVLGSPEQIAITPDETRAYVTSFSDFVTPIDLTNGNTGEIEFGNQFLGDVAILPDGSRIYVTDESEEELVPVNIPSNSLGTAIPIDRRPSAVAIVPNQPPHASFGTSPPTAETGRSVSFDASGSTDSDGAVARYDWDFGDGTAAANGGSNPTHSYAKAGTYTVTLTTTDNEGCSTALVFTGQTAYCNGSSVARTTRQVTVAAAPSCPTVKGGASSFVPKFRSSHVVPGVRVRLAASAPARLDVAATLLWSKNGGGSVSLGNVSPVVKHWRRIRFPIPADLREKLPLGTRVRVKLKITSHPLQDGCTGAVTHRTLKVKVVKVIVGSVQFMHAF